MKRVGDLFDRISSPDVLAEAVWRTARGKSNWSAVRRFQSRLEDELASMASDLRSGSYRFGPYDRFEIRDPKTRTIQAPSFRDRVVHHAIIIVTGPVFEGGATHRSYACRKGMGQHRAVRRAAQWVRHNQAFLLCDIRRFYDSVSHQSLMRALARRFGERRLLSLFERLLESYCTSAGHGLPIGALTSQYLGNFILDPLDHWVLERAGSPPYLRYMDDMLILGDLASVRSLRPRLLDRLASMGFDVKHGGVMNTTRLGVPWLGFVLYPDRIRSSRRGRRRLRRRWGQLERERRRGRTSERALQDRAMALFAHAAHADDTGWRRTLLAAHFHGEALERDEPSHAGRQLEQLGQELPRRQPRQEPPWQPQPQPGLPRLSAPRHGGAATPGAVDRPPVNPPDDVPSRAPGSSPPGPGSGDEPRGWPSAGIDVQGGGDPPEKTPVEAPPPTDSPPSEAP